MSCIPNPKQYLALNEKCVHSVEEIKFDPSKFTQNIEGANYYYKGPLIWAWKWFGGQTELKRQHVVVNQPSKLIAVDCSFTECRDSIRMKEEIQKELELKYFFVAVDSTYLEEHWLFDFQDSTLLDPCVDSLKDSYSISNENGGEYADLICRPVDELIGLIWAYQNINSKPDRKVHCEVLPTPYYLKAKQENTLFNFNLRLDQSFEGLSSDFLNDYGVKLTRTREKKKGTFFIFSPENK